MLGREASLENEGFAVLTEQLTNSEIAGLLECLPQTQSTVAGIRHVLSQPRVSALARDHRLLGIAQRLLGPEALAFRATLFDKSPGRNWLIGWHQDTALPLRERREAPGWGPWSIKEGIVYAHAPASALCQVLALRVHLDESTHQNGPLRVLPGTHKRGVLSDHEIHLLSSGIPETTCIIARGGILAMRPLLVHASSKSTTDAPRRVLHIDYAVSPVVGGDMWLAAA